MLEGLPPNKAAHVMRLRCDEDTARQIADIIVETFDPAETAAAAFEEPIVDKNIKPAWLVEIYFGDAPDEEGIRALIAVAAGEEAAKAVDFSQVEQKDWVASSLAGLKPVRSGRFLVHGSHDREALRENDIGLEIEAALAFGTGHHGSTQGCLAMLRHVARRRRPHAILDVGTGTGILAIAAAKLFHLPIRAGDIDAVSVEAARGNALLNRAGTYVRPVVSKGLAHEALRGGGPYDLVFANILARPLCRMAPEIMRNVARGGEIILSGLLRRDLPAVLSTYRTQGAFFIAGLDIDGWQTLLLKKPSANKSESDE